MGKIYDACVAVGYNTNWQKRCKEIVQGVCKGPRNQQKFNITKQALENNGVIIDLLDLAALVSSTQADSDITGKGTGNQFCENKSTPFPFSSCLGKSLSKDQTASKIAKAYSNIQSNCIAETLPENSEGSTSSLASSSQGYLPGKDDFEVAYRSLTSFGDDCGLDAILDLVERNATAAGYSLKNNWRTITERNIEIWSKK